jgi:hypothetical protein
MIDSSQGNIVDQRLKVMLVLFGAMLFGELTFAVVAVALRLSGSFSGETPYWEFLPYIATVFAAGAILAALLVRSFLLRRLGITESLEQAIQPYFNAMIVPLAICEAPTFFALVVFLLGGNIIWMLCLFVVMILIQLTFFPSRSRLAVAYENAQEAQKLKDFL